MSVPEWILENTRAASAASRRGDHGEAVRILESVMPDLPDESSSAIPWNSLGVAFAKLRRFEDAVAAFQQAIQLNPRFQLPYHFCGRVLKKMGRTADAQEMYRKSIAIKPTAAAFIYLGCLQADQGRASEAEASFREALRLEPDNAEAMNNVASKTGDDDEALALLERALQVDSGYTSAKYNLALRLDEDDRDRAIQLLRETVEERPDWAAAHRELGYYLWRKRDLDDAEEHLRRAVELDPESADAHLYLAGFQHDWRPDSDPEPHYRRACELDPSSSLNCRLYGSFCTCRKRFADAERLLREAVRLDPKDAMAAYRLGEMFCDQGGRDNLRKAVRWLRRSAARDPSHAATRTQLGVALRRRHRPKDAEREFRRGCRLAPDQHRPFWQYARFCELHRQPKKAALLYRAALRRDPSSRSAMFNLGICLVDIGEWETARRWFERFCEFEIEDERTGRARTLLRSLRTKLAGK